MAKKKAAPAKKAARKGIAMEVDLGSVTANATQLSRLKAALKNEVLTWVASDAPSEALPTVVCDIFCRPPKPRP